MGDLITFEELEKEEEKKDENFNQVCYLKQSINKMIKSNTKLVDENHYLKKDKEMFLNKFEKIKNMIISDKLDDKAKLRRILKIVEEEK